MLETVKNYALYAGVDRDSYEQVKKKIEKNNRITAMVFSVVAFALVSVMFGLSFFQEGFRKSQPVYMLGMVCCVLIFVIASLARRFSVMSYLSIYMAAAVFFHYGIALGTMTRPEEQTVTFMVMLLFIPLIFVDKPLRMWCCLSYFITIFIIEACRTKPESILSVDVTDAVIFGILGMVSGTVVIRAKVRGYVLEKRLHVMSETDQLTGLNNRNCYEWRLESYPTMCKSRLGCVYIDVNGLHNLNNTQGHREGDTMLQYIASEVQKQFGQHDTYRIGGDEYVAFAPDMDEKQIAEKLEVLNAHVREKHYHIAVGYEVQEVEKIDMNQLIVQAESKMYRDKSEYYKRHDRRQGLEEKPAVM